MDACIEETYRRIAEEAQKASQAKSRFLANMSHEIRTPLGIVIGFADLALHSTEPDEVRVCLEAIKRNSAYLADLIGDILDLSKIEANHLEITPAGVCLGSLLEDLREHLAMKARDKGLRFLIESQAPLPANIRTDHLRLKQILFNVVGNALKFTREGTVRLRVSCESGLTPGRGIRLRFDVDDTGPGIAEEFLPHLFQPFMRSNDPSTRASGGTGLGLTISRQLARALGGDLTLTRMQPHQGCTFTCTLDGGTYDGTEMDLIARPHVPTDDRVSLTGLQDLRVLLVDDSVDSQILIHHWLKDAGLHLDYADNGKEALRMVSESPYDVILMDLQMPVMNGIEATRSLRERGCRTPILALTADAQREDRERSSDQGFDAYLIKPVQRQTLIDAVRAAVARGPGGPLSKVFGQMEFAIEDRVSQ